MFSSFYNSFYFLIFFSILLDISILLKSYKISKYLGTLDKPTIRKNHSKDTPVIFGILIIKNIFIYLIFNQFSSYSFLFSIPILLFIIFGTFDDKKNINYKSNILFSCFIILLAIEFFPFLIIDKVNFYIFKTFYVNHIGLFLTVLCILFLLIVSNWFDGHNTFSAFYSFSIMFFLIYKKGFDNQISIFILLVSLSILCFAYFNFKEKVFMGSGGIYPLSFIIGHQFLDLNYENRLYFEEILSLCIIQIIDFFVVIYKRLKSNKSIFLPDNTNHYHHILKSTSYNSRVVIIFLHSVLGLCGAILVNYIYLFILSNILFYILNYIYFCKFKK
jgi:UDP-GlcNAc:undecaprenyl-phosphate GlcNAc-1-phosphate transferase